MNLLVNAGLVTGLLFLSALFSSSETALFSLSRYQIRRVKSRHPGGGRFVALLLESPKRTLLSILIGNMAVNIAASSIATGIGISLFGSKGVGLAIGVMVLLLLFFGEITPKTFAVRNAERLSHVIAPLIHIFAKLIWPVRRIIQSIADLFLSLFAKRRVKGEPYITEQELKTLVSVSEKEGVIDKDEREMIDAVFEFGERSVDEIMIPRVDIIACKYSAPRDEVVKLVKESRHTKVPIYSEVIDNITGILFTKEFILNKDKSLDWRSLIKPAVFVPETKKIDELFFEFQTKKVPIAIVADEYGGTAGLVTMEDILEEIVGEIQDEYDKEAPFIERIEPHTFRVKGDIGLKDLEEELGIKIHTEEVETLAGFLALRAGRIPTEGEVIKYKGRTFTIERVRRNRILKVKIDGR